MKGKKRIKSLKYVNIIESMKSFKKVLDSYLCRSGEFLFGELNKEEKVMDLLRSFPHESLQR